MAVSAWRRKPQGSTPTAYRGYVGRALQLELMVSWNVVGSLGMGLLENKLSGSSQFQVNKAQSHLPVLDFTFIV